MDRDYDHLAEQLGSPAKDAAKIRSGYKHTFYPSAICLIMTIFFAFWHTSGHWLLATGFTASALIYFPVGLSQCRSQKQICEKVIRNYEIWYRKRNLRGESKP